MSSSHPNTATINNNNNNNNNNNIQEKENGAVGDGSKQTKKIHHPSTNTNPKLFHYEFGGPIGTGINMILLPIIVVVLGYYSHHSEMEDDVVSSWYTTTIRMVQSWYDASPSSSSSLSSSSSSLLVVVPFMIRWGPQILMSFIMVLAWLTFQLILERYLPATIVTGTPILVGVPAATTKTSTTTTTTLQYRINGHLALWVTLLVFLHGWPTLVSVPIVPHPSNTTTTTMTTTILQFTTFPYWSWLYDNFIVLAVATSIFCYIGSIYLYLHSFRTTTTTTHYHHNVIIAPGGNSGHPIYDTFMGRELNPRCSYLPHWDVKEFCELRPGLMAWLLFNLSCSHVQYQVLGYNTGSMILIQIFQFIYIWDALYQESAILSTMDITTDGFGFMLLFGDLCWVPFTYSLQARYLVHHDPHLSVLPLTIIVGIHLMGYIIFRNANSQKDQFRKDPTHPSVAHLSYIETKRGTKLLTSGYWGMARKINYTGDYIMGVSWCLVCGFDSIVPYFYAIYFLILLVHRAGRDDHLCHEKYGDDWIRYKEIVPYRFIPGII